MQYNSFTVWPKVKLNKDYLQRGPRLQLALNKPFLCLVEPSEASLGHLTGSRPRALMRSFGIPGGFFLFGTSRWSLGDGWQGYRTLPVVVHDVIQVLIAQVHFLGPTNLTQLWCSLSESLRVGPTAVAVDLGVSRVVLSSRAGLPGWPAGWDELGDTWSSVHLEKASSLIGH